jgi:hypothetical protein
VGLSTQTTPASFHIWADTTGVDTNAKIFRTPVCLDLQILLNSQFRKQRRGSSGGSCVVETCQSMFMGGVVLNIIRFLIGPDKVYLDLGLAGNKKLRKQVVECGSGN